MIAQIIPVTRLPSNLGVFDYLVPKEYAKKIKIGQLIKINFRGKKINGLVIRLKEKSEINPAKLKFISYIYDFSPYLTDKQLDLIDWLADYYYISPALAAKLMILDISKNYKEEIKEKLKKTKTKIPALFKIKNDLDLIIKSKDKEYLYWYDQIETKINLYLNLIKNFSAKQILILFSDNDSLEYVANQLKEYSIDYITISSNLPKNNLFQAWQKIKTGRAKIILGTRLAIFFPFSDLSYLIIDEENSPHYKQWEMNPRYDAKIIAKQIVKLNKAKLILISSFPSVDSYHQAKEKKIKLIKNHGNKTGIEIVDMLKQIKESNFSIISNPLIERIEQSLKQKKQIVLILNRKGYASFTVCQDCGFIARCPECAATLSLTHNYLKCPNCNFRQDNLLFCPTCQNPEIKSVGSGTQKIESEIKKIFPKSKIARLDSDINQKHYREIKKLYQQNEIDILIGTKMVLKSWLKKNLGLISFINIDTDLFLPQYQATENMFQLIANALTLIEDNDLLLLQTYHSENQNIKILGGKDWEKIHEKEITGRQVLNYPPFGTIIKLIYQAKNKELVRKKAEIFHKILKEKYSAEQVFISEIKKIRQHYQQFIIIKSKKINFRLAKDDMPSNWLIDLNPSELI